MSTLSARTARAMGRFLWRHWAASLVVILSLLALLTLYQMWRVGVAGAIPLLPQLGILLLLIVAVLVARRLVKRFTGWRLAKQGVALPAQAAKDAMRSGLSQGQATVAKTVAGAKDALAGIGEEVRERLAAGQPVASSALPPLAPRCPSCSRFVRSGARFCSTCGAPLPVPCPQCGRTLRPQARFCDHCGAPVRPGS
jgi:hypothetical protein